MCPWACQRSKSPWSLDLILTDNQSEGHRGGLYPRQSDVSLGLATLESPWSLALIVTDNQSEGRRGGIYPVGVMRFWACQRSKKPLELSSHCDRQPE